MLQILVEITQKGKFKNTFTLYSSFRLPLAIIILAIKGANVEASCLLGWAVLVDVSYHYVIVIQGVPKKRPDVSNIYNSYKNGSKI